MSIEQNSINTNLSSLPDRTIQSTIWAIKQEARTKPSFSSDFNETKEVKLEKKCKVSSIEKKESTTEDLRDRLGRLTAHYMQEIAKTHLECKQGYKKDSTFLRKGIWYRVEFLKACEEKKQIKSAKFISKPIIFQNGFAPPKYFSRVKDSQNPDGVAPFHFHVNNNVLPSEAIKVLYRQLVIGDCGMACQIARYLALLEVLGAEKFNHIFKYVDGKGKNDILPMTTALKNSPSQPMVFLTKHTIPGEGTKDHRNVKIGQLVSFEGAKDYLDKKPIGCGMAFNTICTNATPGEQTYSGLGLKINAKEDDIEEVLIESYNSEGNDISWIPKELIPQFSKSFMIAEKYKTHQIKTVKGFSAECVQDFNIPMIEALIRTPLEKISSDFIFRHPANKDYMDKIHAAILKQKLDSSKGRVDSV